MNDRTETFERVLPLELGRTALLVVDMQRGFLDPGAAMDTVLQVIHDEPVAPPGE